MPKVYSEAEVVSKIASGLIPNYHPELADARISYVFVDKASNKGGRALYGKVKKFSGYFEWVLELDFVVEVAADLWHELSEPQMTALVDHLLEHITGEEDEKTGVMNWSTREPDVQEFSSILDRHGAWHQSLAGFCSIAQKIDLGSLVEADEENLAEDLLETTTTTEN
jgi:hypothetical protein